MGLPHVLYSEIKTSMKQTPPTCAQLMDTGPNHLKEQQREALNTLKVFIKTAAARMWSSCLWQRISFYPSFSNIFATFRWPKSSGQGWSPAGISRLLLAVVNPACTHYVQTAVAFSSGCQNCTNLWLAPLLLACSHSSSANRTSDQP